MFQYFYICPSVEDYMKKIIALVFALFVKTILYQGKSL